MKSTGKCLSERYVLNGIIESRFCDAYAYIFDYIFNFILYNLSLLTLGFLFHHPIAVTIYIIITGSLRAVTGGYHCKTRISCYILSYTVLKCSQFPSCVDFTGFNCIQNCVYCYYLSFFSKIALKHRPHYFHI